MRAISIFLINLLLFGCIDSYTPSVISNNPNYLVVDAFYDYQEGNGKVLLTRTKALQDEGDFAKETGAFVYIESQDGEELYFSESDPGMYTTEGAPLNFNQTYKLVIKTTDNAIYESDYIKPKSVPAIDSVTWYGDGEGLSIAVTTHDPENNTRYYSWLFNETWEYQSAYESLFELQNGTVVLRDEDIFTCWRSTPSTSILIGSTVAYDEDAVYKQPLHYIPKGSQKLEIRYSIEVEQTALDKEIFEFWDLLKNTTENVGGIFDPLPFVVKGNINRIQGNAPAIGIFNISSVSRIRIFIDYYDLPVDLMQRNPYSECSQTILLNENLSTYNGSELLVSLYNVGDFTLGYFKSSPECVDCRMQGGVTIKPDYW